MHTHGRRLHFRNINQKLNDNYMKISKLLSAFAILATSLSFASCNSSDASQNEYQAIVFVDYEGIRDGLHIFAYTEPNQNKSINILSQVNFNDTPPMVGTRVLGIFTVPYGIEIKNDMELECYGIGALSASGTLTTEDIMTGTNQGDQFYLTSVARAGKYIDVTGLATAEKSKMRIVADRKTLSTNKPALYLIYELQSSEQIENGQYFASFDISEITSNPSYTGFTLVVNNSNGDSHFDFSLN